MFPHCGDPAIAGAPGAEIMKNPNAMQLVLERVRYKRAQAEQVAVGGSNRLGRDDLDDLIDALEGLDE
jgi:hypothetical protein